jgi:hypothetical protein
MKVATAAKLPWDRISAVRVERYGLLRRLRLVVRVRPAWTPRTGLHGA